MDNNNTTIDAPVIPPVSSTQVAMKWAMITVMLVIIQTMAFLFINDGKYNPRQEGGVSMVIGIILLFVPMVLVIKEYRDKHQQGYITYGKAFSTGFRYTLFLALFEIVFFIIFYNLVIDWDSFMSDQMSLGMEEMKKRGMSEENIRKQMAMSPNFVSEQWFSLIIVAFVVILFNTIANLIVSAFLKRKPVYA